MAGYQEKCGVLWQNDECKLCHLSLPSIDSWVQHKELVSHLQKVKVKRFLDSSLFEAAEKQSDIAVLLKSAKLPFLGKECIYEFHDIIGGFSFWICTICYYACDKLASITDHLMLTSHRITYMWRFYPENMALAGNVTDLDLDSFAHEIKGEHINSLQKIHFLRLGVAESKAMLDFEQPNGDELSQITRPLSEASNEDENDKIESPQLDDLPSILPQPSDSPVLVPSPVPLPEAQQDTPLLIQATEGVKNMNFLREGEPYIVWCETCWQLLVFPNNGPTFDVFWLMHTATQIHEENKQKRALMPDIESKRDSFVPHLERSVKLDTRRPLNDNEFIINGWIHNESKNQYRYAHKKTAGPLRQVGIEHIFERYTDSEECLLPQQKDFVCELCAEVLSTDIDVQEHIMTENHLMQFTHKEEPVQALELLKEDSAFSRREKIRKWLENHKPFADTKVKVYNKSLNRLHKALLIHNKDDNQVEPSDLGDKEWTKSMTETYDLYQKRNIILTVVLNSGYEQLSYFPIKKTIDQCKDPLIGLQYVIEIYYSNIRSYFCRICCAICSGVPNESQGIMAHLLSDDHRKKYLEKIESNKVFTKQLFQQPFFNTKTFAKNVEEQEKRQPINKRLVFDGECVQQLIECFPHLIDSSTPKTEFLNIGGPVQEVQQLPADFEEALLEVQRRCGVSLNEQDMDNLRQVAIQLGPSHWDALLETANDSIIVEPYNQTEQPKTVEVSMSVQSQPAEVSSPVQVQPTELSMPAQVQPEEWPIPVQLQPADLPTPVQVQPTELSMPAQVQPMESVQVQPEELSMPVQVQPAEVPMAVQNQPVELSMQVQSQPAEALTPVQSEPAVVSMPVQIHREPEKTTMEGSSLSINYPPVYQRSKMAEVCKRVEIQLPTEKLKTVEKSKEVEIQPDEKSKTAEEAKSVENRLVDAIRELSQGEKIGTEDILKLKELASQLSAIDFDALLQCGMDVPLEPDTSKQKQLDDEIAQTIESQKLHGIGSFVSQLSESAVDDKSAEPEACGNQMETTDTERIYCEICRTDVVKDLISQHNQILHGKNLVVTQQTGSQAEIQGIEGLGPLVSKLGIEKHVDHKLSETKAVAPLPFASEPKGFSNEINKEIASSDSDVEVIYESKGNKQSHGGKREKHPQVANTLNDDKTTKSSDGNDSKTLKSSDDKEENHVRILDRRKIFNLKLKILSKILNSVLEPLEWDRISTAQKMLNMSSLLPGVDRVHEVCSSDFPKCPWVSYACSLCRTFWASTCDVLEHLQSPLHGHLCKLWNIKPIDNKIKFRYQYRVDPADLEIIWPTFIRIPTILRSDPSSKDLLNHDDENSKTKESSNEDKASNSTCDGETLKSSNDDKLGKTSNDGKTNAGDAEKLLLRQKILENIHNSVPEPLSPGETAEVQKLLNTNSPLLPGVDQIYEVRSCDFPKCSWASYVCSICPTFWGSTFVLLGHLHSPQHQQICKSRKIEPIDNKIKCRSQYRVDPADLEMLWRNFERIPTTPDSCPSSASKDLQDHGKTGSATNDGKTSKSSNDGKTKKSSNNSKILKSSDDDKLRKKSNDGKTNAGDGKKWLLRHKILENIHNSFSEPLSPDETSEAQKLLNTNWPLLPGADEIYEVRSCDFPECSWVSYVCSICPTWWGSTFVVLSHLHNPQHQQMCKVRKIEPTDNKIKYRSKYRVDPANLEILWTNFKRIPRTPDSGPSSASKDLHTTAPIVASVHGKTVNTANDDKKIESSNDDKVEENSGDWELEREKFQQSLLLSPKDLLQKILSKLHNSVPEPFNAGETALAQEEVNRALLLLPGVDRIYEVCSSDFPTCRWRSYVCALCHNWWGSSCAVVTHLRSPQHQKICRLRSIKPTDNKIKYRLNRLTPADLKKIWPSYKRIPISVDIIPNDTTNCREFVPQAPTSASTDIVTNNQQITPVVTSDQCKTGSGGKKSDSLKDDGNAKKILNDWEMEQEQQSLSLSRQDLLEKIVLKLRNSVPEPFYSGETALAQKRVNLAHMLPGVDRIYEVCSSDFPTCRWRTYVCALCPNWWNSSSAVVEHLKSAQHKKACKLKGITPTDNKIKCRLHYRVNPIHLEVLWSDYKRIPTAVSVIPDDTRKCLDVGQPIKHVFDISPTSVAAKKITNRWDQKHKNENVVVNASNETDKLKLCDKQVPNDQVPYDPAYTTDEIIPIQNFIFFAPKTKDVVASSPTSASTETHGSSQEIATKTNNVAPVAEVPEIYESTQKEIVTWSEKIPSSYKAGVLPMLTIRVEKELSEQDSNSSKEMSDGELSKGTIQSQIEDIQKEIDILESSRQSQLRKVKKTKNTKDSEVKGGREKSAAAKNENSKRKPKENEKELNLKAALNEVKSKEPAIREKLKEKQKEEKSKKAENVKKSKGTTVREMKEQANLKNSKKIASVSTTHENSNEEKLKETANLKKSVAKENSKGSSSENMKGSSIADNSDLIEIKKTNVDAKVDDKNSEELKKLKKDTINSLMFCTRSDISEDELPAIQKQLDNCQEPLVGIDQVIQVCDANYPRSDWHSYLCHLCASWIPEEQLIEHLLSENHRIVYMATNGIRIWDPVSESFSSTSTLMQNPQMLTTAAKQIETNSGRSSITKRSDYRLNVEILKKILPGYQPAAAKKQSIPEVSSSKLKPATALLEVDIPPDPSGKLDKQTTEQQKSHDKESQSSKSLKKVPPSKKTSKQTTSVAKSKKKEPASQKLDKLLTELIQNTSNKLKKSASSEQVQPSSEKLSLTVMQKTTSQNLKKMSPLQTAQLEKSEKQSTVSQKSDKQAEKSDACELRNPSPPSNSFQRSNKNTICDRKSNSPQRSKKGSGSERKSRSPQRRRDSVSERKSNSPQRSKKDSISERKSHSPQRRRNAVSKSKLNSPQRSKKDLVSERKSHSPQRRRNVVSKRKSNSPQRSKRDSMSDSERWSRSPQRSKSDSDSESKSNSPQRNKKDSVSEGKSNSPQRSKKDSVSEKKSRSPQRRRNAVSKRKSNSPQRSKRDSMSDSERWSRSPQRSKSDSDSESKSNSPQRNKKDSVSDKKSHSPQRSKKDSVNFIGCFADLRGSVPESKSNSPKGSKKDSDTKTKPRSPKRSGKDSISEMKSRGSRKRSPSTDEDDIQILSPPPPSKKSTDTSKLVAPLSKRLGSLNSWDSKTIDFLQDIGVTPKAAQPQTEKEHQVPPTIVHSIAQPAAAPIASAKISEVVAQSSVPVKTTHEAPQLSQAKPRMSRKEAILSEINMKERQIEELRKTKELKSIPTSVNRQTQQLPELQQEIEELARKLNNTTSSNIVQPKPSATSSSGQQLRAYLGLNEDTPMDQLLVKMFVEDRERQKKQQEQYSMMANLISHTLMKKKQGQKGTEDILQLSTAFSKINPKAANVAVDIITQMSTGCSSQLSDVASNVAPSVSTVASDVTAPPAASGTPPQLSAAASKVAPMVSTVASHIISPISPSKAASQLLAAAPASGIHPQLSSTASSPVNQRPKVVQQLSATSSQIASTSSPVSSFVEDDNELVRDAAMNILSDNIKGKSEDLRELLESLQKVSSSSVDQISRKRHSDHEHSAEKKLRTLGGNP